MNQTNATSADLKHVVCPHCHTTNRVATADLGAAPTCGKCHQPLFTGHPLALDGTSFDKHIGRSHVPVLVDFWAPWCGPCRMIGPSLEDISKEMDGKLKVVKVNIDENPETARAYRVMSVPTLTVFKNGEPVAQKLGAAPKSQLKGWLESVL